MQPKARKSPYQTFMTRTAAIFRHQKERAAAAMVALNYTIYDLRNAAKKTIICRYCDTPLTPDNISADHADPIDRGGSFNLFNIDITCISCNKAKGNLTAKEFADLSKLSKTWPETIRKKFFARLKLGGTFFRSFHRK